MHVLIAGAGYAGLEVALRLTQKDPSISVTLVNPSPRFRERIRDHQWASGTRPAPPGLVDLLRGTRVELRVGRVSFVHRKTRWATVTSSSGSEVRLPWDYLVLAMGSVADFGVPGAAEHAISFDGSGAQRAKAELFRLAKTGGKVVVVGGGTTGIETATEVAESFDELDVELVSRGGIGEAFSPPARRAFARSFERLGVTPRPHLDIHAVEPGVLRHGRGSIPFDVCLWTAGFRATPPPEGLDLPLDHLGRVWVSEFLDTPSDPRVFVAGDGAAHPDQSTPPIPSGCKSAGPSGRTVADNVLARIRGEPLRPFRFVAPLYCVSLGRKDGLVQRTARDGSLSGWVLSGRPGAWTKELICKATLWAFAWKTRGIAELDAVTGP